MRVKERKRGTFHLVIYIALLIQQCSIAMEVRTSWHLAAEKETNESINWMGARELAKSFYVSELGQKMRMRNRMTRTTEKRSEISVWFDNSSIRNERGNRPFLSYIECICDASISFAFH